MTYTEKCKWLADFYREAAETGREMEINCPCAGWIPSEAGPDRFSVPGIWRLKPEPLEPEPQKLWIVWNQRLGFSPWIWGDKAAAERCAEYNGGILQEITRPDIAKAEGRGE